jgi:hypothetical protein
MIAPPIRIVPLRAEALAPVARPRLTYRGGPLLSSVEAFLFFWGEAWRGQADLMEKVSGFFDYVVTSPLIDQLSEYNVQDFAIGRGSRTGAIALQSSPPTVVADAEIQAFVREEIASEAAVAEPTANSLYFVFLPTGVTVDLDGASSCLNFCGYHGSIDGEIFYAVMPYPECEGCSGEMPVVDALTVTSSHELCEAITDPIPGQGWYDDMNGEIADICAWQTKRLGGYAVQLEWSNREGRCV